METAEKISLITAFVFAVISMGTGIGLSVQASRIVSLQKMLAQADTAVAACRDNVSRQNVKINAYMIDIANARAEAQTLGSLIDEDTKAQKVWVVERLVKDQSCEEQLRFAEDMLDEFYKHD
jgi:hypothetical protein